MSRVCRPEGRVLLLEHGRSTVPWINHLLDWTADTHERIFCCRWNQEPLVMVDEAGLRVRNVFRRFLGIYHLIEAVPDPSRGGS